MHTLATTFRLAQFAAHDFHQRVSGRTFLTDHAFFAELYESYETAYDQLVERIIGQGESVSPSQLTYLAAQRAEAFRDKVEADDMYAALMTLERTICREIDTLLMAREVDEEDRTEEESMITTGVENLLQGMADASEVRQYKFKQRLK